MIVVFVIFIGICLGSFVNALVWRTRQRQLIEDELDGKKPTAAQRKQLAALSVVRERSHCSSCDHVLGPLDLVPILSYALLRGKCRYCSKRIEDTPLAELLGGLMAAVSYLVWPHALEGWASWGAFAVWLIMLTLMLGLSIYDARWRLLPNRLVAALTVAGVLFVAAAALATNSWTLVLQALLGALLLGGLFWLLYQLSAGRWIGGGDVKLAPVLGLLAGSALGAFLLLFAASLLGTIYACVLAAPTRQPLRGSMRVPFGPFLIGATVIVVLWGERIARAYQDWLLGLL